MTIATTLTSGDADGFPNWLTGSLEIVVHRVSVQSQLTSHTAIQLKVSVSHVCKRDCACMLVFSQPHKVNKEEESQ